MGGYFLSFWTDFPTESEYLPFTAPALRPLHFVVTLFLYSPGIDASDPRWVGAWWLGFLISAIGVIFVIVPMSGFPKDLPGAASHKQQYAQ